MTMFRIAGVMFCLALAGCSPSEAPAPESQSETTAASGRPGEEIYQNYCFSCHTPGLSGAPKLGDAEAWAPRIAKGDALLLQSTIDGMPPAMPARGMCFGCSDEELAAAIEFMVQNSQ